jgi:hypothetical protein
MPRNVNPPRRLMPDGSERPVLPHHTAIIARREAMQAEAEARKQENPNRKTKRSARREGTNANT